MEMDETFLPHKILQKVHNRMNKQILHPGLYIVSTPIGNILDVTLRGIFILQNSFCIFAEDTRVSKQLLDFYGIKTKIKACDNYREMDKKNLELINSNRDKIFSIITDAGTPLISDPGYKITNWCMQNNIRIFPIPGACSAVAALSVSGCSSDKFFFYGFLPQKKTSRIDALNSIKHIRSSIIFFESPNRILNTLIDMLEVFGDRDIFIGREMTKLNEEYIKCKISALIEKYKGEKCIGEFVIILDKDDGCTEQELDLYEIIKRELAENTLKDTVKNVHEVTGANKKEIYSIALEMKNG